MNMYFSPNAWIVSNLEKLSRRPEKGISLLLFAAGSADLAGQIGLRARVFGIGENFFGRAVLDKFPKIEENDVVGDAGGPAARCG